MQHCVYCGEVGKSTCATGCTCECHGWVKVEHVWVAAT